MAKDNVHIINVNTDEARKSLKELKKDIEASAIALAKMKAAGEDTAEAEEELARQQNILNEAMTLAKKAGKDAEGSYNALSKQMSELRKEWKATGDEARRAELAGQINDINDKLKKMDASTGNFQRNVGNYTGSIVDAMGKLSESASRAAGAALQGMGDVAQGIKMLQESNPIGAIILLVSSLITNFETLSEVLDFRTSKAIKNLRKELEETGKHIKEINEKADFAQRIAEAAGTARTEILGMRLEAAKLAEDEARRNLQSAYAIDATVFNAKRVKQIREEAKKAYDEAADARKKAYQDIVVFNVGVLKDQADAEKALAEEAARKAKEELSNTRTEQEERAKARAEAEQKEYAEAEAFRKSMATMDADVRQARFDEEVALAEERRRFLDEEEKRNEAREAAWTAAAKEQADKRKAIMQGYVAATMTLMGSLADILESGTTENEKAAKAAKALRIAEATVNTISGAVAAYMDSVKTYGQPAGLIIGAVQAAAVTAAGMAQIASMRAVTIDKNAGATATASATTATPRVVAPPRIEPSVTSAANTTSAQEDQQLNAQRVVLVYSDVEAAANHVRVVRSEATF